MKRISALLLALVMLCAAGSALALDAAFPKTTAEYDLPEIPEFAKVSTLRVGNTIYITLSHAVDSLTAQWLGYNEEPEELTVSDDLTATLSTEGHRYQVGARWVNGSWTWWEGEFLAWIPYFTDDANTKVITAAEVKKIIDDANKQLKPGQTLDIVEPAVHVMKISEEPETYIWVDDEGVEHTETWYPWITLGVYPYGTPEDQMEIPEGAYAYYFSGSIDIYTGHKEWAASNGNPDEAYLVKEGDWNVIHHRDGRIKYFTLTLKGTDFFGIGVGTATVRYEKNNAGWYVRSVVEEYDAGDIASAGAWYNGMGNLLQTRIVPAGE